MKWLIVRILWIVLLGTAYSIKWLPTPLFATACIGATGLIVMDLVHSAGDNNE